MTELGKINPAYESEKEKIAEIIGSTGYILLSNILSPEAYASLKASKKKTAFRQSTILNLHNFSEAKPSKDVARIMTEVTKYIQDTLNEQLLPNTLRIRKYSKGSYTMQHDLQPAEGIDIILFIADDWQNEYRGELTYTSENPIYFYPQGNTLGIIVRNEGIKSFVKRVTYLAGKSSFIAIEMNLKREYV